MSHVILKWDAKFIDIIPIICRNATSVNVCFVLIKINVITPNTNKIASTVVIVLPIHILFIT